MRRIIGIIIALLLLFQAAPQFGLAQQQEPANASYEMGVLESIKIIKKGENPQKEITKGEFLSLVAKTVYPDADFSVGAEGNTPFLDVDKSHPYYGTIQSFYNLAIIKGSSEGLFYPDQSITTLESLVILIRALGYSPFAEARGGYPAGYYSVAKEAGLSKGIDLSKNQVTMQLAAKLIYQALFADLIQITSIDQNEISVEINRQKNLLSQQFNIYEYDGIVIDNGIYAMKGESIHHDGQVVIQLKDSGQKLLIDDALGLSQLLGCRIKVFVRSDRETGKADAVFYRLHSSVQETKIFTHQIVSITDSYLEYEMDPTRYRKIYFEEISPLLIYNGIHLYQYSENLLKTEDGIIRLVDSDGNGKTDLLEMFGFNTQLDLESIPKKSRYIVTYPPVPDGENLYCKLDPENTLYLPSETTGYKIYSSQGYRSINELKENTVVSVAQAPKQIDGKDFYFLFVSDEKINGIPEWVNEETGEIQVDGKIYEFSEGIRLNTPSYIKRFQTDSTLNIWFDITGKIVYGEGFQKKGGNYAYLIAGTVKKQGDSVLLIKLFTQYGEIQTAEVSGKASINGKRPVPKNGQDIAEAQYEEISKRPDELKKPTGAPSDALYISRPVLVEWNKEGKIISIDTDYPNYTPDKNAGNLYSDQTNIWYSNEEVQDSRALKAGYRNPRRTPFNQNSIMDHRFYINSETVIMAVPDVDTNGLGDGAMMSATLSSPYNMAVDYNLVQLSELPKEDKNYQILSPRDISTTYAFDLQGYDIDPETGLAGLMIVRGRQDIYRSGAVPVTTPNKLSIFLRIAEVFHEYSGKRIYKIYFTTDGKAESSCLVDPDELYFPYVDLIFGVTAEKSHVGKEVTPIKKGDIIRIIQNGDWLSHIERVWNVDKIYTGVSSMYFPSGLYNPYEKSVHSSMSAPFDQRLTWLGFGPFGSYTLGTLYVKSISGTKLNAYISTSTPANVDLTEQSSYVQCFYDVAGTQVTKIDIDELGAVTLSRGHISDIVTVDQVKGDLKKASMVVYRHRLNKFENIIIVNDKRISL